MPKCVFINLASATDRRRELEASFERAAREGWTLERFEARGPSDVAEIPGNLRPGQKACFESHRALIGQHLDDEDPLFVVEDDAVFSASTFAVLDDLLGRGHGWDILFTDLALSDPNLMVRLAKQRDVMVERGTHIAVDLRNRAYAGSTAYVIQGHAKRKLHAALASLTRLDLGYDIALRVLCNRGAFAAGACFPFVTSISPSADASQLDASVPGFVLALNAFRRLMYVERDLEACRAEVTTIERGYDQDTPRLAGAVLGAMISPMFPAD